MLYYEVKDMVREHFGRLGLPTSILDIALAESRKMIEREGNFWWMRGIANFNLVASTTTYAIGSGLAIDIAKFKDARALQQKTSTATRWEPVELGVIDQEDLNLMYDNDDTGEPEYAIIDNTTLYVYPPLPDAAYNMRLYYYKWTDNPGANTSTTDELCLYYGSALVYGALIWGFEIELKIFKVQPIGEISSAELLLATEGRLPDSSEKTSSETGRTGPCWFHLRAPAASLADH